MMIGEKKSLKQKCCDVHLHTMKRFAVLHFRTFKANRWRITING